MQVKEGQELGQKNGAGWIETSAKNNINVGETSVCTRGLPSVLLTGFLGKVFELCLGEIERRTAPNQAEPQANRCVVM